MLFGWLGLFGLVIIFGWLGVKLDDRREVALLVDRMHTRFGARWLDAAKAASASQSANEREAERRLFVEQMGNVVSVLRRDVDRLLRDIAYWNLYQEDEPEGPWQFVPTPEEFRAFEAQGHRVLKRLTRLESRAKDAGVEYPPSFAYYLRIQSAQGGLPLSPNEETLTFERYSEGWREAIRRSCDYYRQQLDSPERSIAQ